MASIRHVAEHVDCWISTVSRVIDGSTAFDKETRRTTRAEIEPLGFQPHLIIRNSYENVLDIHTAGYLAGEHRPEEE